MKCYDIECEKTRRTQLAKKNAMRSEPKVPKTMPWQSAQHSEYCVNSLRVISFIELNIEHLNGSKIDFSIEKETILQNNRIVYSLAVRT